MHICTTYIYPFQSHGTSLKVSLLSSTRIAKQWKFSNIYLHILSTFGEKNIIFDGALLLSVIILI